MGEYLSVPVKEKQVDDGENIKLRYGACGMQGWRRTMEDTHIANLNMENGVSIFGVFDGHGGKEVAMFVEKHFCEEIRKSESFKMQDYKAALVETFLKLDTLMTTEEGAKELTSYAQLTSPNEKMNKFKGKNREDRETAYYAGCTACVALITPDEIYVANAGDSRCVAYRDEQALELSTDHSPELEGEKTRIEKAGGYIEYGRVNAALNLTRSLGDLEYKLNSAIKQEEQIITAFPDVRVEKITPNLKFLMIACDGIWDCLTSEQATEYMDEKLDKIKDEKDNRMSRAIEILFDKIIAEEVASAGGIGCDNMTCVVVAFKH